MSPVLPDWPPARYVSRGDDRIAWFAVGPETGPPLMLVHGLAASGLQFSADAHWFAARGYRAVVPDLRGHGRSLSPARRSLGGVTLEMLADDIAAVRDAAGLEKTDYVGNSLGGMLGLMLADRSPDRMRRLVTFGTALRLDVPRFAVTAGALGHRLAGPKRAAALVAPFSSKVPRARALIAHITERIDADAVRDVALAAARYDLRAVAAELAVPWLMICGSDDTLINRALAPDLAALRQKPGFTRIGLPGAGHCANLDRPDAWRLAVLDFLRSPAPAGGD